MEEDWKGGGVCDAMECEGANVILTDWWLHCGMGNWMAGACYRGLWQWTSFIDGLHRYHDNNGGQLWESSFADKRCVVKITDIWNENMNSSVNSNSVPLWTAVCSIVVRLTLEKNQHSKTWIDYFLFLIFSRFFLVQSTNFGEIKIFIRTRRTNSGLSGNVQLTLTEQNYSNATFLFPLIAQSCLIGQNTNL